MVSKGLITEPLLPLMSRFVNRWRFFCPDGFQPGENVSWMTRMKAPLEAT